jgi:CheY-like chemotaxis protein
MKHRVLVVDDYPDAVSMFEVVAQMLGHEVRGAYDGAGALVAAAEFRPDVVFLDLSLPDLDGFEVARRLRALPGLESAVLIALTGWADSETVASAKAAGFAQFLVKPFDPMKLEQLLDAL